MFNELTFIRVTIQFVIYVPNYTLFLVIYMIYCEAKLFSLATKRSKKTGRGSMKWIRMSRISPNGQHTKVEKGFYYDRTCKVSFTGWKISLNSFAFDLRDLYLRFVCKSVWPATCLCRPFFFICSRPIHYYKIWTHKKLFIEKVCFMTWYKGLNMIREKC